MYNSSGIPTGYVPPMFTLNPVTLTQEKLSSYPYSHNYLHQHTTIHVCRHPEKPLCACTSWLKISADLGT